MQFLKQLRPNWLPLEQMVGKPRCKNFDYLGQGLSYKNIVHIYLHSSGTLFLLPIDLIITLYAAYTALSTAFSMSLSLMSFILYLIFTKVIIKSTEGNAHYVHLAPYDE
jgi:hypothetical protein